MQKVALIQMAKLVRSHLTTKTEAAPHGVIQLDLAEAIETVTKDEKGNDKVEHFVGSAGDLYCTDQALCERAAALLDDLLQWAANERECCVRVPGTKTLIHPVALPE